jgi:hypothetical protein
MRILIAVLAVLITGFSSAQEKRYFDAPFGGGGGYVPGWYMYNVEEINKNLMLTGVPDIPEGGIYSSGGAGFIYLGLIPNVRIGGMGFGGAASSVNGSREVRYSFGGGGITVEYTLPFIKGLGVSIGTILGAASQNIEIYRNSGDVQWTGLWDEFRGNESTENYSRTLENNYWILSPTLNIDIPFYRFFIFRLGGGYNLSLGNKWEADNNREILNVPSGLNGNGFFIQSGIFVGFFSF